MVLFITLLLSCIYGFGWPVSLYLSLAGAGLYRCEGSSFGFLLVLDDVSLVHVVSFVIC